VIFFLGLKDDILVISPIKKFIGQVLAAFIIIYYGNIQIRSMNGFLGVYQLPEMFSLLLTYFAVIVVINSFNLIDGVDGLAGSLGLLSTTIFGIYFLRVGMPSYAVLAFSLAGSLLAFLIFNFQPAKIFMGDTGSLLVGTVNAILVVKFINVANSIRSELPDQRLPGGRLHHPDDPFAGYTSGIRHPHPPPPASVQPRQEPYPSLVPRSWLLPPVDHPDAGCYQPDHDRGGVPGQVPQLYPSHLLGIPRILCTDRRHLLPDARSPAFCSKNGKERERSADQSIPTGRPQGFGAGTK
jgi:hypothetical protein